jgi:biopolymer transport protein ExbB
MKIYVRSSLKARISIMVVALVGLLMACQSLAQDAGSAPAAASLAENVEPADPGAPAEVAEPVVSGIPTDPLGIADAMGRPFTAAFIIASVIGVWSVIERLVVLRRRRVIPRGFVDRFLMHLRAGRLDKAEALKVCQQNMSPMADIFIHGLRKWGRPSTEVEQAVTDGGERQVT